MRREKLKSAWLVTWERVGKVIPTKRKIVGVFDTRLSPETVRRIIELMYLNRSPFIADRISYLKNRKNNPYAAEFGKVDGVEFLGEIHCGAHPWLQARRVDDLCVNVDKNGREFVTWKERSKPKPLSRS